MAAAIEQFGKNSQRDPDRLGFLLLYSRKQLLLQTMKISLGKYRVQNDVGVDIQRLVEGSRQRGQRDSGGIQTRTGAEIGSQTGQFIADLQRAAATGPFVKHAHRQSGGSRGGKLVGGITGIGLEVKLDHGYGMAP